MDAGIGISVWERNSVFGRPFQNFSCPRVSVYPWDGGDLVAAHKAREWNCGSPRGYTLSTSFFPLPSPYPSLSWLLGSGCKSPRGDFGANERGVGLENLAGQRLRRCGAPAGRPQEPRPQDCFGSHPAGVAGSRGRRHPLPSSFSLARTMWGRGPWPLALILDCETAQCPRLCAD